MSPQKASAPAKLHNGSGPTARTRVAAEERVGLPAFLRQYQDIIQSSCWPPPSSTDRHPRPSHVRSLVGLTIFNAIVGFRQEAKAEESVEALSQMMKTIARVGRDGQPSRSTPDVVTGDVVLVEAGNLIRTMPEFVTATLEVEEAALTGKSARLQTSRRQDGRRGRPWRPDLHGVHEHLGHPWAR